MFSARKMFLFLVLPVLMISSARCSEPPDEMIDATNCHKLHIGRCSMEYQPVCVILKPATAPHSPEIGDSTVTETYPNRCIACADERVLSYAIGACAHHAETEA